MSRVVRYPSHTGRKPGRKLLTVLFLICIGVTLYLYLGQALIFWQTRGELNRLQTRLDGLRGKNMTLQEELLLLQDESYLELRARTELGLVRPGEIIFSVGD